MVMLRKGLKVVAAVAVFVVAQAVALADAAPYQVEYMQPVYPVPARVNLQRLPQAPAWQPGDPIKEIPKRRRDPESVPPPLPWPPVSDPLLERQATDLRQSDRAFSSPSLNIAGEVFTGVNPPDTVGDIGADHYIQMVNGGGGALLSVYDKAGAILVDSLVLDTISPSANCNNGLGDPIVVYDQLADRWLITEFTAAGNGMCVYVSMTSDPVNDGLWVYEFTAPGFPDYPKYSVWSDAYYITSNEAQPAIYALDRDAMLNGEATAMQRVTAPALSGFGFQALTPVDADGPALPTSGAPGIFLRHRDDEVHGGSTPGDYIDIFEFSVDFDDAGNSVLSGPVSIEVSDFDSSLCGLFSFECFPQPGSGVTLDPLREVVMWRAQYRNFGTHQSIVGNFVTDVDGADRGGIRWFELRDDAGGWSLHQEGTHSPDAVNRWMGGIAMDGGGNVALGYNVSDSVSVHPGIRYTGRLSDDPTGTMTQAETTLIAGTGANGSLRYGDYSAMGVDPVDECTFWFTGEHNPGAQWATRIGAFKFDSCTPIVKADCSGVNVSLSDKIFDQDAVCVASESLEAVTNVEVTSAASVTFVGPSVILRPPFRVELGSAFHAALQ